jgi:hypothetical protein
VAKAHPAIRFNEHIEGDGPTVFAHACKPGHALSPTFEDNIRRAANEARWAEEEARRQAESRRAYEASLQRAR